MCAVVERRGTTMRLKPSPVTEPPHGAALSKPKKPDFCGLRSFRPSIQGVLTLPQLSMDCPVDNPVGGSALLEIGAGSRR